MSKKPLAPLMLLAAWLLLPAAGVRAQSAETIWLEAASSAFKTGEAVAITVHANSATPASGFTFQIRYDPACLEPVNSSSPIPGMTGLALPQTSGLVDASFAGTTPVAVNGILADVRFVSLRECQTTVSLESAALVIRDSSGFAAPLAGVTIGTRSIPIGIDPAAGVLEEQPLLGTPLPLQVSTPVAPAPARPTQTTILLIALVILLGIGAFVFIRVIRGPEGPSGLRR